MNRRHAIYQWFRDHGQQVDLFIMLGLFLLAAVPYLFMDDVPGFVVSACLIIPLAFRRSRPAAATGAAVVVCLVQWVFAVPLVPAQFAVLVFLYTAAAYAPKRVSVWALIAGLIGGVLGITRYFYFPATSSLADIPVVVLGIVMVDTLVLLAWTFGDLARTRRLQMQALEDRAHRLEIERQHERELAAADERSHIAREMHDIVAHSLSVIITQADGGRYAAVADPDVAPKTLETIAETGRTSLREMRRLLGVLRGDDDTTTRPLPTLADVDELVNTLRSTGLEVECSRHGEPRRQLPPGAELTAYRIVQESLTNVLKHAGPRAMASVELDWNGRGLELTISDDGRGAAADPNTTGAGQGIRGMAERAKLYDGSLSAQPRTGGGFRVSALIPYTEA
ncbi:sensor histidine kinase [Arthrobacter monumenti]